jgi:hypothetical protein
MSKNQSLKNSKRSTLGNLSIVKKQCTNKLCNHDRAFQNNSSLKCTRCKTIIERDVKRNKTPWVKPKIDEVEE